MISLSLLSGSGLLDIGLILVFVLLLFLLFVLGVRMGWIFIGKEEAGSLEKFYRVVDGAYDDWDRDFDAGPRRLSVWVNLEPMESSGSLTRDIVAAYKARDEPPRIGLTAFPEKRRPISVIVSSADRPAEKPFACLFPEGYPGKLIGHLTLIEWRHRLQKRWPKAEVGMHYYSGEEPAGWRKQLEHAEEYVLDRLGRPPRA